MSLPSPSADNANNEPLQDTVVVCDEMKSDDKSQIPINQQVDDDNNRNSKCEGENDIEKDCSNNPSPCYNPAASDSPEKTPPSLTKSRVSESNSDDCILIPKHAVVDDVSLKFILHPNLSPEGSLHSGINDNAKKMPGRVNSSSSIDKEELDIPSGIRPGPLKPRGFLQNNAKKSSGAKGIFTPPHTPSGEQYVIKTAKEILYDIAQGRWNRKGMIIDEETEGTKKVASTPCSNANCVRAAERERCIIRDKLPYQDMQDITGIVFEDGNLPSYHSLLNFWKVQEEKKQRHFWTRSVFKNGYPENENEFLKTWRECRKNPKAFGITISKPEELPDILIKPSSPPGWRTRSSVKSNDKTSLVGKTTPPDKRPPIRLVSKEYYNNSNSNPVKSFRQRAKQKRRYEELRKLYPHLPALRDVDYRLCPSTVKYRTRQAEEWHELVNASNKPTPNTAGSNYASDITYKSGQCTATDGDFYPESPESSDCGTSAQNIRGSTYTRKGSNLTNN